MSLTGEFDVTKSKAVTKRVVGHNLGMIAGGSGDYILSKHMSILQTSLFLQT